MQPTPSCAIYCRVSTDSQREKSTIDSQRRILPEIAAKKGLSIYKEYVDDGISGESIEHRPAFQQLLDDSSRGVFQAVLVIDFDRLTRATDLTQLALIKKIFRDNNVVVITPSQTFDFHDNDQDFLSDLFGILAKHEKRKILLRTGRGRKEKMLKGQWIMGRIPIPYYRENGAVLIDELKKKMVLNILDDALTNGRPTISRKYKLGQGMLRRMLSPGRLLFYAGFLDVDGLRVRGSWEPIIDLELADKVLAHADARQRRTEFTKPIYLLTGMGIFICGKCARAVGSHTDGAMRRAKIDMKGADRYYRRGYYRCNNRQCDLRTHVMHDEELNRLVLRRLDYHLSRLDLVRKNMAAAAARSEFGDKVTTIERKIKDEESRKRHLINAISKDVIRLDEAAEELKTIRTSLDDLNQSLRALQASTKAINKAELDLLKSVTIYDLNFEEQRKVIKICIEKLELHEANLFISFRFPVSSTGRNVEQIKLGR